MELCLSSKIGSTSGWSAVYCGWLRFICAVNAPIDSCVTLTADRGEWEEPTLAHKGQGKTDSVKKVEERECKQWWNVNVSSQIICHLQEGIQWSKYADRDLSYLIHLLLFQRLAAALRSSVVSQDLGWTHFYCLVDEVMFPAHTESLLSLCVMEKYSSVGRAILLLSGLGRSGNRTMKDKTVSTLSVHQLRSSFISLWRLGQTPDFTGCLWRPLPTIRLTGQIGDHRMRPERSHIWIINLDVRHVVLNNVYLQCTG